MQCPNCGRNVRSKNQCAYCGHVFNKGEVTKAPVEKHEHIEEEVFEEELVTRRSKGGFGRVLWGIIKLVLAVAIVFLAFLFGPRLINNVVEYFQPSDTELVQNQPESIPDNGEQANVTSGTEDDPSTDSQSEQSGESSEEVSGELAATSQEVNLDEYPMINIDLEFDQPLSEVSSDTFAFTVETNGESVDLGDDYSLVKDGQTLSISFNDPAVAVLSTESQEQVLNITSESLGVNESISYELPSSTLNAEQAEFFNTTITENLSSIADVSAVIYPADADLPFVYANQSVDADTLIAWFVLGHTFDSINNGELTAEDAITVTSNLISENEESIVSMAEEGSEFTVEELMTAVVQDNDVSAMNHLIQATGGPNSFNLWLNESNYFSTKVTQLLTVQENGEISGAVTSVQDIAQLLEKLATDELVSPELDATFKELIFNSPITEKYPEGQIEGYQSRYEIATSDANQAHQYYSGIIELDGKYYIAVVLASNYTNAEEVVPAISTTINEIVTFFETGQTVEEIDALAEEVEPEPVVEESTPSQVSVVEEEPIPEGSFVGNDGRTYSSQYVENIGSYVDLPTETVYDESTGQSRPAEWFFNEESQSYQYR